MTEPAAAQQQQQQQEASTAPCNSSSSSGPDWFEYWVTLFTLCEQSSLLGVALVVPPDLPSKPAVQRWLGQPLKALLLPTSEWLFVRNALFVSLGRWYQASLRCSAGWGNR
jgi:hypothetical protein